MSNDSWHVLLDISWYRRPKYLSINPWHPRALGWTYGSVAQRNAHKCRVACIHTWHFILNSVCHMFCTKWDRDSSHSFVGCKLPHYNVCNHNKHLGMGDNRHKKNAWTTNIQTYLRYWWSRLCSKRAHSASYPCSSWNNYLHLELTLIHGTIQTKMSLSKFNRKYIMNLYIFQKKGCTNRCIYATLNACLNNI